jgi:hypothetical protein
MGGLAVALLSILLFEGGVTTASPAHDHHLRPDRCVSHGSRTLRLTRQVRLYRSASDGATVAACSRQTGRRTKLGVDAESTSRFRYAVRGAYVGYSWRMCDRYKSAPPYCAFDEVGAVLTTTGRRTFRERFPDDRNLGPVALSTRGALAWIDSTVAQAPPGAPPPLQITVRREDKTGVIVVDSGEDIDADYLHASRSQLFWKRAGVVQSASFR